MNEAVFSQWCFWGPQNDTILEGEIGFLGRVNFDISSNLDIG